MQYNEVSSTNLTKKAKEPRFVPYEPYKAAVKPLVAVRDKGRRAKLDERIVKVNSNTDIDIPDNKVCNEQQGRESLITSKELTIIDRPISKNDEHTEIDALNNSDTTDMLNKTQILLEETQKKLEDSEKQLKIQIQVILWCNRSYPVFLKAFLILTVLMCLDYDSYPLGKFRS